MSLDDQPTDPLNTEPLITEAPAAQIEASVSADEEDSSPFAPRAAPSFDRAPKALISITRPGETSPAEDSTAAKPVATGSILQRLKARKAADDQEKKGKSLSQPEVAASDKPKSGAARVFVKATLSLAVTGALAGAAWHTQDYWWIPSVEAMATVPADKRAKIQSTCDAEIKSLPAPLRTKLTQAHEAVQRNLRVGPPDQAAYTLARDAVRAAEAEVSPLLGGNNPIVAYKCRNFREYQRLDTEQQHQKWLTAAAPFWATTLKQLQDMKAAHDAQVAQFAQETAPLAFNTRVNTVLMGVQKGRKLSELQAEARFEVAAAQQLDSFFRYGGGIDAVRQSEIYPVDPVAKTVFVPMVNCADAKSNAVQRKPLSDCAGIDKPTLTDIVEVIPAKKLSVWILSANGWTHEGKPTRKGKGVVNVELEAAPNTTTRATDWALSVPMTSQNRKPEEMPPIQVEGRPEVKFF